MTIFKKIEKLNLALLKSQSQSERANPDRAELRNKPYFNLLYLKEEVVVVDVLPVPPPLKVGGPGGPAGGPGGPAKGPGGPLVKLFVDVGPFKPL